MLATTFETFAFSFHENVNFFDVFQGYFSDEKFLVL